jgi:hypothetical protein
VLELPGAPRIPCAPFMFLQLCVPLCVADGVGVAAVLADPALLAAVPAVVPVVDDDVVDPDVDEWLVAALATARLPPSPTPSAPAPTAVAMMILPSLVFKVSASSRLGDGPEPRTPTLAAALLQRSSGDGMKSREKSRPLVYLFSGRLVLARSPQPESAGPVC